SRLFAGNEHEVQTKKLVDFFKKPLTYYKAIDFNPSIADSIQLGREPAKAFRENDLASYETFELAYHYFMFYLVKKQIHSTKLIMDGTAVKRIFVDGGFSKNPLYMNFLAMALPSIEIYAASMARATALGAALAIHSDWNTKAIQKNIIELTYYPLDKWDK
ncbi:MAG: FGGY-family carbohydrate kinase, partial [Chitinophagaceae bacterium]